MFARVPSIVVLLLSVGLVGCSGDRSSSQKAEGGENRKGQKNENNPKGKTGTESEAKAVLKKALDSWAFGDSKEKFEKNHPEIKCGDLNWATGKKLARYDIGTSRKNGRNFQVTVKFTLAAKDGTDIVVNGDYDISYSDRPPSGEWDILGGAPYQ